ncbi:MAG: alpha/beta fold hydrolase, partial [Acidimicrobiia bacterium]|nr:alpha/beta fold hydrolase [Acidimicrobiia bacterium]
TWFAARGYPMYGIDLPGCGTSPGRKGYVDSFDDFLDAVEGSLAEVGSDLPTVLYGHSLGGLIAATYALSGRPAPDRLLLSSPGLAYSGPAWQKPVAMLLSRFLPTLAMPNGLKGEQLSTDPAVGEAYFGDPLVLTKTCVRMAAESFAAIDAIQPALAELSIPTYVLHGSDDSIVPPQGSAALGALPNATRKLWAGLRHECHNEPNWEEVLDDALGWLDGA